MVHTLHKKWRTGKKMDSLMQEFSVEKLVPGVTFTAQNELILSCTHEQLSTVQFSEVESAFQADLIHSAVVVKCGCT